MNMEYLYGELVKTETCYIRQDGAEFQFTV